MDLGLKGRAVAVSAASKGIGRACAEAFAREGADVAICARGEEALREAEKAVAEFGTRVRASVLDLTKDGACERFIADAAETFGRLDVCVTNVGGPPPGTFDDRDDAEFRRVLDANFMVHVRLARAAIPHMRARGWGRIVNITSASVKTPIGGLITGNSARAATTAWAKTLSYEVARDGITVNCVAPEAVLTERIEEIARNIAERANMPFENALSSLTQTPLGRAGRPEEAASLVVFLASDPASFVNGATVSIDGGQGRALT